MVRHINKFIWLLVGLISITWLAFLISRVPYGVDFYPLYFGAQKILSGQSPYGVQATHDLTLFWDSTWAYAGIAYPLPFILLIVPFTLLSVSVASFLWTVLGFATSYTVVFFSRAHSTLRQYPAWYKTVSLLLPFTFWPFFEGVRLSQATLLWFGITLLLILGIQRKNGWITAICIVLLALKPQNGIIFALYGAYWLWRNHKGGLAFAVAFGITLLGVSLWVQPDWISAWMAQMKTYSSVVKITSLMPLGAIVLYIAWRFPIAWWAKLAIIQVLLFPITGNYSLLPLLLAWCGVSPLLALFGTSVSWLWPLLSISATTQTIWALILLPLLSVILWEGRPTQVRAANHQPSSKQGNPLYLR